MAKFEITSPDGKRFEVTAPDGASENEILSFAQQQTGVQDDANHVEQDNRSWTEAIKDSGKAIMGGVHAGVGDAIGAGIEFYGEKTDSPNAQEFGRDMRKFQQKLGKEYSDSMSERGQALDQKQLFDGVVPNLDEDFLPSLGQKALRSLPGMVVTAPVGGAVASGIAKVGGTVIPGVAGKIISGAASPIGGNSIRQAIAQQGVTRALTDRALALAPTSIGYGGAEGALAGLQNSAQIRSEIEQTPFDQLAKTSPLFAKYTDEAGGDMEAARNRLAKEAAEDVAVRTTISTGGFGILTGGGALGGAERAAKASGGKGALIEGAKGFIRGSKEEAVQEFPQSGGEAYITNLAKKKYADQTIDATDGVLSQAMEGMAVGAATGGVFGGSGGIVKGYRNTQVARGNETGDQPAEEQFSAGDIYGAPEQPISAAKPTESDKALYTPKSLTALDRVNEIDAKLAAPDITPAEVEALTTERGQITATWPKAVGGAQTSFSTETGAHLNGQYALMEAGDLTTSHDENLRPVPTYPTELQPRERERHASEMQVQQIVGKLDPARLGESADVATGAPIVGADGLVESGNARTIALKRVYQADGQTAQDYKNYLKANADRLGIQPEAVDSMQNPVLVRIRTTPVNRAEFARQANASTVARMSPSEQAKSDAAQMDSLDDLNPDEQGEFISGSSRPFVRRFMAKLPVTEQAGLIDASGQLSQTGYTRIRNAVLAKAYGDSPVLLRMVESVDDDLRNVSKALLRVAPNIAKTREAIGEGALHDADITPDLMAAVEELSELKKKGVSVEDGLAQAGIFGDKISPESKQILKLLNESARSPRRIAEFIQAYLDALTAAGNPGQQDIFGEKTTPAKNDLMGAARRAVNGEPETRSADAEDNGVAQKDRGQPKDAQGNQAGNSSNEATGGNPSEEWVSFPQDSGTLGIPRAEMPQIKGDHRGALIQFLEGRGITHETVEIPASQLKPTQAEFSVKKAQGWKEVRDGVDRSVLASSDDYILDGHHQWVAALALNEPVKVIQFDAPIKKLLDEVKQFPSVKRSEGGSVDARREAINQQWNEALADLGAIVRDHANVARVIPEDTPGLMPTLVKLFEVGIAEVGHDMKVLMAHVKNALKKIPEFKSVWNKIDNATYRKAAAQALENHQAAPQGDLFAPMVEKAMAAQGDLFSGQPDAKVGDVGAAQSWEDRRKGNFVPPTLKEIVTADVAKRVGALVEKWKDNLPEATISEGDRAKAEALLKPVIDAAVKDEPWFDVRVREIGKQFIGSQLGPTKKIERAAIKLVEESFNVEEMKDIVRATIVVNSYDDAQSALDAITKKFKVIQINNKTDLKISAPEGAKLKNKGVSPEGYSDVTAFVRLPGGGIAEVQINIPEMLSAKLAAHVLYEGSRVVEDDPARQDEYAELRNGQLDVYQAALASLLVRLASDTERMKYASSELQPLETGAPLSGTSATASSSNRNQLPSGNLTNSSPPNEDMKSQPSGNLSGTFISTTSNPSIAQSDENSYTKGTEKPTGDANGQLGEDGSRGAQGQGSVTAQGTGGKRKTASLRDGTSGRDQLGNNDADGGNRTQATGVQERQDADGAGRGAEDGGIPGNGARVRRNAGVPAGRDIPAKSGRNYRFGDDDLTYAGSWIAKARQNVEAVELLKKLQAENRQATRDEQSQLAKFIGWGASELANNMFGPQDASGKTKLDRRLEALENYDEAIQNLGDRPYLTNARYHEYSAAFRLLQSKNPALNWYTAGNITKAMLDEAKPDASVRKWGELRDRLKAVLTQEEFREASKSTQYAHYTSKSVVSSILSAVEKMGFKGGTILEPGAGIGVFPGLMQTEMGANSVYTGIEFDPVTGGILKQLFPDERILVESFIDSKLPENFYDVAIGNPPFSGQVTVLADPKYAKHAFKLHDYFFAKSLDSVKPGGLVVFVTSRYTMDKKGDKARTFMAERADLVGAIRLPQTAFQKNAGTDVVTDVLFLRKKVPGEAFAGAQSWMGLGEVNTPEGKFLINEYFTAHPEMVLGEHSGKGKMQNSPGPQYTLLAKSGDIESQFAEAAASLPKDVFVAGRGSAAEAAKVREMDFNPKAEKEGAFYISDAGVLMRREGGVGVRAEEKHQKDAALIKDYVALRDVLKQTQYDQLNDGDWESSLKALQKAYAGFVKKNGRIGQNTPYMQKVKVDELDEEGIPTGNKIEDEEQRRRFPVRDKVRTDPEWVLVAALENVNDETGEVTESDWLSKRILGGEKKAEIRTPTDALLATLDDTGEVNIPLIAERVGLEESEVIDSLGTLIYDDPANGWTMADDYLSGNVKAKLAAAEEAAKSDKRYQRNVDALKDVQPSPKGVGDIKPQIGMNWIPGEVYAQFLRDLSGVEATIEYVERTHEWTLVAHSGFNTPRATSDWGVGDRANAAWLIEKALTGATISLSKPVSDGKGGTKMVFDPDRTEAANAKRAAMRQEFQSWIFQDAARATKLVTLYNDKFNTTVQRKFDGRHLTLPGMSSTLAKVIFNHVKRGAWRVIQTGNAYLAHAVGSGKTLEMVISAMEQKRLGKIKKPMMIVPGHMLQQFASEWQQAYPTARLAVADEKDFHTDNRRKFVARVAMSDLDGVIMTHSSFKLLDLDPTFKREMIEQELEFLRASYEEAGGDIDDIGNKKMRKEPKIKRIEAQIERLEQSLAKTMSSEGKDKSVRFDEMGVDFLYVDEAHLFRKLSYATNRQMKGIDPNGSEMAWDLYMKTRWLAKKNPKRYMVMASGTPITNTTAELYTVQRFMAPEALEEKGLQSFDDWAAQFGEEATAIEATSSGKYEPVTRFSKFINVGEMTQMFRDFADVLTEDHLAALLGDKRPKVAGGARKSIITPKTDTYVDFQRDVLIPRIEESKAFKPSFDQPNNPDPIININTDARLASIDMRFMNPTLPNDTDSKLNRMIDEVIRIYKETAEWEYGEAKDNTGAKQANKGAAQMVFFESGFGRQVAINRGFNARAWMEKRLRDAGIPSNHLAFMEDYKKSTAKLKLFKDVNTGNVRILVGSSVAMGTGVNAQQRLIALHHLDAPMVPAILEQREGRIVRQGNKNSTVQIYAYSMKGSFDENQWGMLARKKFFIEQAMSGDPNIREIDDVGEVSQLELAAGLVAENPYVMQHAGAKAEVERLMRLSRAHEESRARMQSDYSNAGRTIEMNEKWLPDAEKEAAKVQNLSGDAFVAKADGKKFNNRKEWGAAVLSKYKALSDKLTEDHIKIGEMSGFDVVFVGAMTGGTYQSQVRLAWQDTILASDPLTDPVGMAMRGVNALVAVERKPADMKRIISDAKAKRDSLTTRLDAPFPLAEQLANKVKEVADLERQMIGYAQKKTGLEREQEIEDDWQQRTGAITPLFSRGTGSGMDLRDLNAVVDRVSKGFKNLPKVHVFASPADLSTTDQTQKALRDFIKKSDAWNDVEGATHDGEIYLFASGMADEARAEHVLATHEITHYGLRGAVGKELDAALQHVLLMNAKVRKAAAAMKAERKLASNIEAVEEVLADIPSADLAKLRGWRKVVQVVRNWLNKAGAKKLADRLDAWMKSGLSDQEKADLFVADLVNAARDWVKNGKSGGLSVIDGTRLAEQRLSDDLAEQEKWLAREAKARGYKSIDELAEKDYKVFESLAALWRKKHPVDVALMSRSVYAGKDGILDQTTAGETIDGARLKELRRAAAGLESPRKGIFLTVTEDGRAIATGETGTRIPETFIRFARVNGLKFSAQRIIHRTIGSVGSHVGDLTVTTGNKGIINPKSEPMPIEYRESGALYFGESGKSIDRTGKTRFSTSKLGDGNTAAPKQTTAQRAEAIINKPAATPRPLDALLEGATKAVGLPKLTSSAYGAAASILDRYTPEQIKAGMVSDYGIPEAVIDQRAIVQGRQKRQLRAAGTLLEKLSTLTRAESRVAYEWMNTDNPQSSDWFMEQLPPESIKTLAEVEKMIDGLSKEAVRLGQLDEEAYKRNRFAYLHRSYAKHTAELTGGETAARKRAIAVLGDQYKGRGMTDAVDMAKIKNASPEWWNRKTQQGKADKQLKGERFIRLERRASSGEGTAAIPGMSDKSKGRLLEVAYWPAGEAIPARYGAWDQMGTWEVRDTKGDKLIVWRDFTKQERESMGEIDEARYAIAKTLHGMIHDVETGKYLQWLGQNYAKIDGEAIDGKIVEASDRMRDTYKTGEWVKVPDVVVPGTKVKRYGALAGRYLPAPIWNDVRQTIGFRYQPLGETYAAIHRAWKASKTALSPAVHMNNVMANFVMADWHDVTAGHVLKALRLMTSKDAAADEVLARFGDSGGSIGTWAIKELQQEQLRPLLDALEKELGIAGNVTGQVGVMSALQLALKGRFPSAWDALKPSAAGKITVKTARAMIDLYEAEDQVFRLAAWLKAKEDGATDQVAGKVARKSFLDYNINAPWVQMMRSTALPFVAFTYRAAPMMLEIAAKKPWKLIKLGLLAGAINALGYMLSGGDEDDERKLLPEEKAGRIWGITPKLIRMPWNDANGSPVFLDIRRWIPAGDIFDTGQSHAALPILPSMTPGGPLALMAELMLNKQGFTGKSITLETDTAYEQAAKLTDYLYKAFAPNIAVLPGTYAWTGISNAGSGKTDSFGREQSLAQSIISSVGVKLGSYPPDVLRLNAQHEAQAKMMEIDKNITALKREFQKKGIDRDEFNAKAKAQIEKKQAVEKEFMERLAGS